MTRFRPAAIGMPAVLVALCLFFTWATWTEAPVSGADGGRGVAEIITACRPLPRSVLIVAGSGEEGRAFAAGLRSRLAGRAEVVEIGGTPAEVRGELLRRSVSGAGPHIVAASPEVARWPLWDSLKTSSPALSRLEVLSPRSTGRSAFLSVTNLRNVADQIAVIAIIAVGMTMVIITGGIDLSVGSLVALSAVAAAWLIRALGGGQALAGSLIVASLGAIALSGAVGAFSGAVITRFRIPPFIATLAMMQVASGLAFIVSQGQTVYEVPAAFTHLGRGAAIASLPNTVVLMLLIYAAAHILMSRAGIGRRIYAVGGNAEAARLSGVNNARTLMFVYVVSGLMAGIGGVITASQLKAGSPTYGLMYELYVIAAVVVGGTSLSGGEGRIFGTLVGAFIIAVIRNGMNLMNVEPYTQKVVLGLVILGAVLVDRMRRGR